MNILNVNQSSIIRGGSDIYWQSLSGLLKENNHVVYDYYSIENGRDKTNCIYPKALDFENPDLMSILKYCYNVDAGKKIARFISDKKINTAHLHIYYGKLTASILKPLCEANIPIVQTLHEYKLVCPTYKLYRNGNVCHECRNNNFYNALVNKCNRNSFSRSLLSTVESYVSLLCGSQSKIEHFITVSDYQRNEILKMGFAPHNVTTIHNFIDDSGFEPSHKNPEYILYFGRIEKEKGIDVIIDAARILCTKNIKFILAGEGSYLNRARSIVNELGLSNIEFLGYKNKNEIIELINGSFTVIAPSLWYETFGLVLLEAFSCAKPVIASNIGGMTEIINDGVDGFLVLPGSAEELAEKIEFIVSNPRQAQYMGEAGYKKQKSVFSKQAHFKKLMSVYSQVGG